MERNTAAKDRDEIMKRKLLVIKRCILNNQSTVVHRFRHCAQGIIVFFPPNIALIIMMKLNFPSYSTLDLLWHCHSKLLYSVEYNSNYTHAFSNYTHVSFSMQIVINMIG